MQAGCITPARGDVRSLLSVSAGARWHGVRCGDKDDDVSNSTSCEETGVIQRTTTSLFGLH